VTNEFNNNHTNLSDVHIGDHVAFMSSYDKYWTVATVTAETEKTVSIGKDKFMRRTGYRHGDTNLWHKDRIEPLGSSLYSVTYAELIRESAKQRLEDLRRNKAYAVVSEVVWRKLSTDALEQIAAIVTAERAKETQP